MNTIAPLPHSDSGGNKPVLVFLHGLSESREVWTALIAQLSKTFRCIAFDLPGHGEASSIRIDFSMHAYAESVLKSLQALSISSCTLVGHSMGAQMSVILAVRIPAVVERLILFAPAGIETFTAAEKEQLNAWTTATYQQPFPYLQLQQLFLQHVGNRPELADFLAKIHATQHRMEQFSAYQKTIAGSVRGMLAEPVFQLYHLLQQPILAVYGDDDRLVPNRFLHPQQTQRSLLEALKNEAKQAVTKIVPKAGHYLPLEYPDVCAQEVLNFLRQ